MIFRSLLRLLFWPGVILLGILIGAGSALIMLQQSPASVGPWSPGLTAGSSEADSYTRARISLCCLLALTRKEAVYYRADRDSKGDPLRSNCTYRVTGRKPDARWWSLTVYGSDYFLIETKYSRYSANSGTVKTDSDGQYSISVGPAPFKGAWLPTTGNEQIYLLLRAYNPSAKLAAAPQDAALPVIQKVGTCR